MLLDVINAQLKTMKLAPSNKIGATRLLSKVPPNQVPLVEELRPITLLPTDYKIMSKVVAKRMIKILPSVIKSPQSCSVPGTNICVSASKLLSLVEAVSKDNGTAAILSLDWFKSYD